MKHTKYEFPSGEIIHQELTDFSFDKGIKPRKQVKKPNDVLFFALCAAVVLLVLVLKFYVEPRIVIPEAHAAETEMTDLEAYKFWDANTKTLCNDYLNTH